MSASDLIKLVGHKTGGRDTALLDCDGLSVAVRCLDVKQVFGRVDVRVTPINGSGEKWVQVDRLRELITDTKKYAITGWGVSEIKEGRGAGRNNIGSKI
jgi:hypothetical protein